MYRIIFSLLLIQGVLCTTVTKPEQPANDISLIFTSSPSGCSNSIVYRHDSLYSNFIIIETKDDSLMIDTIPKTVPLSPASPNVTVRIDRYSIKDGKRYAGCFEYCNDVVCAGLRDSVNRFSAISGSMQIRRSKDTTSFIFHTYRVYIQINNVILEDSNKVRLYIRHLDFDSVYVGWLPG
jgi:hypothetical protein